MSGYDVDRIAPVVVYLGYVPYTTSTALATCLTHHMSTFRHVMMMRFKEGTTPEQERSALAGLGTMPDLVPGILRYEFGLDLGINPENPDLILVADFASEEDWRAYLTHPEHTAMAESVIAPVKGEMTRVQYLVE